MYDRKLKNPRPNSEATGMWHQIETLIGITGARMAKYRASWFEVFFACLNIVWRPHLFMILWFEALLFGFSIGINVRDISFFVPFCYRADSIQVTNAVFLGTPQPVGYGYGQFGIAGVYGSVRDIGLGFGQAYSSSCIARPLYVLHFAIYFSA